ncbi:hypothetical protein CLV86_2505 [Lacinutrix venerupis]|uniref:Uncharacterized protein n=1 Tax=Lacinutrix venerupis TaxID=1486034 RepID=A0AAC9LMW9_9FLAO|nr:hypothetical protein [Lacinutrix venerupis]APY01384.1 hypothetical protein BWR22_14095 [Lacinutrix venerupis]RLJ61485.1 hypothetical protein CLV86_2505 [Lacinutrix venerupis]
MKITIISLDNWGFNSYIEKNLIAKGIETTSINFNDFTYKYPTVFHRIFNFFLKNLTKKNLKEIHLKKQINDRIESLPKQDKILVIKSDFLNLETLLQLKSKTNELITFINDSISRYPKIKKNINLFDKVFSFENKDCKKHGFTKINNFIYTCLDTKENHPIEYQAFNISSIDKRKKSTSFFADYFNTHNISFKIIVFSLKPAEELKSKGIVIIKKPYSISQMLDYLKKCKVVLDLQRPKQQGLSFRVFESLAFQKKLITLNKDIVKYDFYDPENILVVKNIKHISIPDSFLKTDYKPLDKKILEKYHISNWTKQVFNLDK